MADEGLKQCIASAMDAIDADRNSEVDWEMHSDPSLWEPASDHILNARVEPNASAPTKLKVTVQVYDGETIAPHEIEVPGMRYTAQELREASKTAAMNKARQQVRKRVQEFQDKLKQACQEGENSAVVTVPIDEFTGNTYLYEQIKRDLRRCGFVWRTKRVPMSPGSDALLQRSLRYGICITVSFRETGPCYKTIPEIRRALESIGCKSPEIQSLPETIDFKDVPFSIDLEPGTQIIRLVPVVDPRSNSAMVATDWLHQTIDESDMFAAYNLEHDALPFHRIVLMPVSI